MGLTTPFLADLTRAIFFDAVTIAGVLVPVFLGLFAIGSLILAGRK